MIIMSVQLVTSLSGRDSMVYAESIWDILQLTPALLGADCVPHQDGALASSFTAGRMNSGKVCMLSAHSRVTINGSSLRLCISQVSQVEAQFFKEDN